MYHLKVCSYCQISFEAIRSDANYCSALCRTKASQYRRYVLTFEKEKEQKIQELQREIDELKQKILEDEKKVREQKKEKNKCL